MSESEETEQAEVKLRRRLLGYKRADVEGALQAREEEVGELAEELDEREAEVGQLRQDIAALWLAFAQHDRTIEDLRAAVIALAEAPAPPAAAEPVSTVPRREASATAAAWVGCAGSGR